jgi:RHS repeat-associated protein
MRFLRYIFTVFFFAFIISAEAQSACKAVQLKFHPTDFYNNLNDGGRSRRSLGIAFMIRYKVIKNSNFGQPGSEDVILFDTGDKKCYTKYNAKHKEWSLFSMDRKEDPFYVTLCFENNIDLSDYYIEVESDIYGWNQVMKSKNHPSCSGSKKDENQTHNYRISLEDLNTNVEQYYSTPSASLFKFKTKVIKTDIPYPELSMPEVINVCANEFPYTLNIDSSAYTYNLKMKYFDRRETIISKYNSSTDTWTEVFESSETSFVFPTPADSGRYSVFTTLNGDCWMTDTFDLKVLPIPTIYNNNGNILDTINYTAKICPNGIANLSILPDTNHTEFLWKDPYDACISRYPNLTVEDTGKYSIRVRAVNGCYHEVEYDVTHQPTEVVKFANVEIPACFNPELPRPDVTLTTNVSTLENYTFKWSNKETDPTIIVKQPGAYRVEATDGFGCISHATVQVLDTCKYPVHSDVLSNSVVTYLDKSLFEEVEYNTLVLEDPRSVSGSIAYNSGDIIDKKFVARLQYHRSEQSDLKSDVWMIFVPYQITVDDRPTEYRTLQLKKTDGEEDLYMSVFVHEGGDKATLQIIADNITAYDKDGGLLSFDADIPNDLNLELELKTLHVPVFSGTTAIDENKLKHQYDVVNQKIEIVWQPIKSAIEYELEIAFIDVLDKNQSVSNQLFKEKGWSIVTSSNTYTIDATYPKGKLVYRVRPLGRHTHFVNHNYNHIINGAWSDAKSIDLNTAPFEQDKNWSKVVTFAEEGKKKEVISYMDGTFRTTQVLTNLNTEGITLAAETYYDHESRGTLSILPAPLTVNSLKYQTNLNQDINGAPIDKIFVDNEIQLPLNNNSGASQYYSENNPFALIPAFTDRMNINALPDANGYVTTKVEYSRDNTGRVVRQSGVGEEFIIDGDSEEKHVTQYFYNTPTPTELNRLFGSNIGEAVFYTKQMVVDPNGQVSVSYLNNSEKVIATALSGNAPDNLDSLARPEAEAMTVNMSGNNIRDSLGRTSTSVNIIGNDVVGKDYAFFYEVGTGKNEGVIGGNDYCKNCKYKLELFITNPKGIPVALVPQDLPAYATAVVGDNSDIIKIEAILDADLCNNAEYTYPNIEFSSSFEKLGNYTYTKKLTLLEEDELDIQDFLEQIEFPSLEEFITEHKYASVDSLVCRNDCGSRTAVYIRDLRLQDSLSGAVRTLAEYQHITDSLVGRGFCDPFLAAQFEAPEYAKRYCDDMLMNMVRQISPGERYFDDMYERFMDVFNGSFSIQLERKDSLIAWNVLRSSSADNANSKDSVTYRWNDSVARKILHLFGNNNPIHPEYCHYTNCIADTARGAFDIKMGLIDSFEDAKNSGYIKTSGDTYEFGTALNAEIALVSGLDTALNEYIRIARPFRNYLLEAPNINSTKIRKINIIGATRPHNIYYHPDFPTEPDSGYSTSYIYYRDSCELYSGGVCVQLNPDYDKDASGSISKSEWNDQFWLRFKVAFLATKKQQIAKNNTVNCPYSEDDEAIIKNPNISVSQGLAQAMSHHTPEAYQSNCASNAGAIVDKLARECKAVREKIAQEPSYKAVLTDSLVNYCIRNAGVYNPFGFITQNDIDSGKLDNFISSIHSTVSGSDSCNLEDILNTGIEYFYGKDSSGNVVVHQVCLDSGNCSVRSIIDIANEHQFQYPRVGSLIFREGFDGSGNSHYDATSIYKNAGQKNGFVFNRDTAMQWVESVRHDYGNSDFLVCFFDDKPAKFDSLLESSIDYMREFYDATGDSLGNYQLNYTDIGNVHRGVFWKNKTAIKVEANQHYLLSYHIANHSYGNADIVPIIISRDSSYSDTLLVQMDTMSCVSAWNKYQIRWKAPIGVDSIYIVMFNRNNQYWGNDFSFDELRLETLIDTNDIELPCAGNKSNKFFMTPSEITASYSSCQNANGGGGGLYTIFFVDSAGNRVDNIEYVEIDDIPVLADPISPMPEYRNRAVSFLNMKGIALLSNQQEKEVFLYNASCATPNMNFNWNGNPDCEELIGLTAARNNYLLEGSNYTCDRRFDTCVVKFIPELDSIFVNGLDSIGEWRPDTSLEDCVARQVRAQQGWLTQVYQDSLAKILTAYRTTHIANCFTNLTEDLYYSTTFDEYHYTLYYYDQQGNLVQTIPPEGVYPVPPSGFTDKGKWLGGAANEPKHVLKTTYQYNTRQQPIAQHSPDGGLSTFWYNKKGQLILSQNENQKPNSLIETLATPLTPAHQYQSRFSFTNYDALGRIVLVGEIVTPNNFTYHPLPGDVNETVKQHRRDTLYALANTFNFPLNFLGVADYELINLVQTEYDYSSTMPGLNQKNLHNRVSATYAYDDYDKLLLGNGIATIYSYDEIGNVQTMVQDMSHYDELAELPQISEADQLKKQVDYDYDLVSGKVNAVVYNHGKLDQFKHRYEYDADNRITDVFTSDANQIEHHDAKYFYYPHGPLARIELGDQKVQSLDYAYTLQGWLKGINFLEESNHLNGYFPKRQLMYLLGYNVNDYRSILSAGYENEGAFTIFAPDYNALSSKYRGLYNGNIAYTTNILLGLSLDKTHYEDQLPISAMQYKYDQLNRITSAYGQDGGINGINRTTNGRFIIVDAQNYDLFDGYRTSYQYDANGNILTLNRNAPHFATQEFKMMDSLRYVYARNDFSGVNKLLNNRLYQVFDDQSNDNWFDTDIDNQTASVNTSVPNLTYPNTNIQSLGSSNYAYDRIGNLTKDIAEGIDSIHWTPYGKIDSIVMSAPKSNLKFKYDATGNRVAKIEHPKPVGGVPQPAKVTYYFRDAQGNPIDIVQPREADEIYTELHEYNVYGSSRLGTWNKTIEIVDKGIQPQEQTFGNKQYELNNHLGNVMTTLTDQKYISGTDGYVPVVATATDYHPFGMPMPGRSFERGDCSEEYVKKVRPGKGNIVEHGDFEGSGVSVSDWFSSARFMSPNGYKIGSVEWVVESLKVNLRDGFEPEDSMTIAILVHEFAVPSAGRYKVSFDLDKSDSIFAGGGIVSKDTLDFDFFNALDHGGMEEVALAVHFPLIAHNEMNIQVSDADTLAIFIVLNTEDTILRSVRIDNFLVEKIAEEVLVDIKDAQNNHISDWFVPEFKELDSTWNDYIEPLSKNIIDTVSGQLFSYYQPNNYGYYGYVSRDYIVDLDKTYKLSYDLVSKHPTANAISMKFSDQYKMDFGRHSGNLVGTYINHSIGNNIVYFTPNDTIVTVAWWADSYGQGDTLQPYFTISSVVLEECAGNDPVVEDLIFQDSFSSGNFSGFLGHDFTPLNETAYVELDSLEGKLNFRTEGEEQLGSRSINLFQSLPATGFYQVSFDFETDDTTGLYLQFNGSLTDSANNHQSSLFNSAIKSDTSYSNIFYANDLNLRLNFYMSNRDTSLIHSISNFKIHQLLYTDTCYGITDQDLFSETNGKWRNSIYSPEYLLTDVRNYQPVSDNFGNLSWDSLNHQLNIHKNSYANIAGIHNAKKSGLTDMWFAFAGRDLQVESNKQYRIDFTVSNLLNSSQGLLGNMVGVWNSQEMTNDPFEANSVIGKIAVEANGRYSFVLDAPSDSLMFGVLNYSYLGIEGDLALQLDSIEVYEIERLSSYDSTLVLNHHFEENDTSYVNYLENIEGRTYIGEVEYDSAYQRLQVSMVEDEEEGYVAGVLRKMELTSGKDMRIQVHITEDSIPFEGAMVLIDNMIFNEPQMYPISGGGLHEIVIPSQSGAFQFGVVAWSDILGSYYIDSIKIFELNNIAEVSQIVNQQFDEGIEGWRSSFKKSNRIPLSTLEWIEDSTALNIHTSDYLSLLKSIIPIGMDSLYISNLLNVFKIGVAALPLEVTSGVEHTIQYFVDVPENHPMDTINFTALAIYDRALFEQSGQNIFGLMPVYVHVDTSGISSLVNLSWIPSVEDVVLVLMNITKDTSTQSIVSLRNLRISTIDSTATQTDTVFYQAFADSSSIEGWRNSFLETEDATQEVEFSVLTHDTATGRMRVDMMVNPLDDSEYIQVVQGIAGRRLTGLQIGKEYVVNFRIETDSINDLDSVNLIFFRTSLFDSGILGEPDTMINIIYPSDSLEARFEALDTNMVMIIVVDRAGADPYHYYIDDYSLREGWIETIGIEEINGVVGELVFCSSFDTLGSCISDTSGWVNEFMLIEDFSSLKLGEIAWKNVPAQDSSGVLILKTKILPTEEEDSEKSGMLVRDLGLLDTGSYEFSIDVQSSLGGLGSAVILAYTDSILSGSLFEGEAFFTRVTMPNLSAQVIEEKTVIYSFDLDIPTSVSLLIFGGEEEHQWFYVDNMVLKKKLYPTDTIGVLVVSDSFDTEGSISDWRNSTSPFSLVASRFGDMDWDEEAGRLELELDQNPLAEEGLYSAMIGRHLTGMRKGETYILRYKMEEQTPSSITNTSIAILLDAKMNSGMPIPDIEGSPVPDIDGMVTFTFEAPAESFWILLGADKEDATSRTKIYIYDISLNEGWKLNKKCPLPGSIYANKNRYRFGFNGKENDSEVEGQQDYGFRVYDWRIGRFRSTDPLAKLYPWYTTYQFAGNSPISNTDLDGAEPKEAVENWSKTKGFLDRGDFYKNGGTLLRVEGYDVFIEHGSFGRKEYQWYNNSKNPQWQQFVPNALEKRYSNLGPLGDNINGKLNSHFEKAMFENYWLKKGNVTLSQYRFDKIKEFILSNDKINFASIKANSNNKILFEDGTIGYKTAVSFYTGVGSGEYDQVFGTATIYLSEIGKIVGLQDTYDFDVRMGNLVPIGETDRSFKAEVQTDLVAGAGAVTSSGQDFKITYGKQEKKSSSKKK